MADIYKIAIGYGKSENQHQLVVGSKQIGRDFKITLIERDEEYLRLNGESRFKVWVQEVDEDGEVIGKMQAWLEVERQPVIITYDVKKGILLDK